MPLCATIHNLWRLVYDYKKIIMNFFNICLTSTKIFGLTKKGKYEYIYSLHLDCLIKCLCSRSIKHILQLWL